MNLVSAQKSRCTYKAAVVMATLSQDCMMLSKTISISEWTEEPILHMTLDANPACSLLQQHFFSDTLREMPLCLAY